MACFILHPSSLSCGIGLGLTNPGFVFIDFSIQFVPFGKNASISIRSTFTNYFRAQTISRLSRRNV